MRPTIHRWVAALTVAFGTIWTVLWLLGWAE